LLFKDRLDLSRWQGGQMAGASLGTMVDGGVVLLINQIVDKVSQGGLQQWAGRHGGGQRVQEHMR